MFPSQPSQLALRWFVGLRCSSTSNASSYQFKTYNLEDHTLKTYNLEDLTLKRQRKANKMHYEDRHAPFGVDEQGVPLMYGDTVSDERLAYEYWLADNDYEPPNRERDMEYEEAIIGTGLCFARTEVKDARAFLAIAETVREELDCILFESLSAKPRFLTAQPST